MKLLPATSSFLFVILILLFTSCKKEITRKKKISKTVSTLENIAFDWSQKGKQDSAVFYAQKMLSQAEKENSVFSIKKAYNRLNIQYRLFGNYDSARYYGEKLYNLSEKTGDSSNMAKAKSHLGFCYKKIDSFKLAIKSFTDSKNLYLKIGDTIKAGKKMLEVVNIQKSEGNFGAAELSATEGLDYLEGTKELRHIAGLYLALTSISRETGRIQNANDYIDKGLALVDSNTINLIGKKTIGKLKNAKGNTLRDFRRYDEAIDYFNLALEDYKNDTLETKRTQFNLAHTHFLKKGFNKISDSLLRDSYAYFFSEKRNSETFSTLLKLAELYKDYNQNKFLEYINKALESAEGRNKEKSIYEALELKLEVFPNKNDFKIFATLGNKLERDKENLDYFYIHNRFNYEDEERQKIKAENDKILAENKAKNRKIQNLILSLVIISLLVVAFLIYQRIKRRHKIEKVKTVHVTEARISSKVHDELANDLYELMTQLETANPEKETVLDKLDTIYNQARDISKQIQTVETDHRFPEELNNLFRSYQSNEVNVLLKRYDTDIWKGISSHIKVTVYRVLQEFLTNMKKHSNAALVVVSIEKQNKQLFIQYIDNGKGFTTKTSKNGLLNAENRIRAIKGKLTFDTELDKGCKFSINVPV